jgi:uncharacterized membrane protein
MESRTSRIQSIDFVRGLVMVLMAIDHVRVYSGVPPGGPDPGIFFTRWVTHFCAPTFAFLCGTSAYLYGIKLANPGKLAGYLLSRGLLLVVLELTLIRFFWTFNLNFSAFTLAGVIWMLGWCMVLLALFVRSSPKAVGITGLVIIFFQFAFGLVPGLLPESSRRAFGHFWEFIYSSGLEGPAWMAILYVIVPWIGVMMAGYGFGAILQLDEISRRKILIRIGLGSVLAFLLWGSVKVYMNPVENAPPFIFQLLNQKKYPASPLFLLMTLGPSILLMAITEKANGAFSRIIKVFGRVPFFYYLLHILLIHVTALLVQIIRDGHTTQEWFDTAPYVHISEELHWSLGLLYLVFVIDVIILYFACRWYDTYKSRHPEKKALKFI